MKRILLKGAAFALLVCALEVSVELLRGFPWMPARDDVEAQRREPKEILYFGDSVQNSLAPGDVDRRDLFQMVRDLLPERRIGKFQAPAFGLEMFEAYAHYLGRQSARPSLLLIPINLRSLSPEWEPRPEYQFRAERFLFRNGRPTSLAFLRPLHALKAYPLTPLSPAEFRDLPVLREGRPVGHVRDFLPLLVPPPGMALEESQFVFRYMNAVTPDSRGPSSIRRIARLCRDLGIAARFYVTPVDVESGELAAGAGFRRQVAANVAVLRQALAAEGLPLLDLSSGFDAGLFDWRRNLAPNEHLTERGRAALAKELAALLRNP